MILFFTFLSPVLGLLIGAVAASSGVSALRSFIACYAIFLVITMIDSLLQAPFVYTLLSTMMVAAFSFVPAAGGCALGAFMFRETKPKDTIAQSIQIDNDSLNERPQ